MNPYPNRVPKIVARAVRLGWEARLTRPSATEVELHLRETSGRGYTFDLRWKRESTRWAAPRHQNIETVVEYLTRVELEQEAAG